MHLGRFVAGQVVIAAIITRRGHQLPRNRLTHH